MQTCPGCNEGHIVCGHSNISLCPECIGDDKSIDSLKEGVYGYSCLYCTLISASNGNNFDDVYDGFLGDSSFEMSVATIHDIYRIGYNDSKVGKSLPEMDGSHKSWEALYKDGYNAGNAEKRIKDLEEKLAKRTEEFCTLLPDFLAKGQN